MIGKRQNLFSQSTKLYKAFMQGWKFQQNYRFSGDVYNYWHSCLNFHFKINRNNILVFTEDLIFFLLYFSPVENFDAFSRRIFQQSWRFLLVPPEEDLVPHARISCSVARVTSLMLSSWGIFPWGKNVFVFKYKNVSFSYTSVSYMLSQQGYSPHD